MTRQLVGLSQPRSAQATTDAAEVPPAATSLLSIRACVVVTTLSASGGVNVALSRARALAHADHETDVLVPGRQTVRRDVSLPGRGVEEAEGDYDVAIGTWWGTAECPWKLSADRRLMFLQSVENRFYREHEVFDRAGAAAVLGLPVDFIVVADWMHRLLAEVRPDARCRTVPNGIDKAVFSVARRTGEGPLRVLVEGSPGLWYKGVQAAVAVVREMRETATVTVVSNIEANEQELGADRVVVGLDAAEMAAQYAEHDVLLRLARVESLALAPIEAFHAGLPCVVTPYTGHEEYVRHGKNGLIVGFDDQPGAVAALDLLARDRGLLERLSRGALQTAAEWPDAMQAGDSFVEAVTELAEGAGANDSEATDRMMAEPRLAMELGRRRSGGLGRGRGPPASRPGGRAES